MFRSGLKVCTYMVETLYLCLHASWKSLDWTWTDLVETKSPESVSMFTVILNLFLMLWGRCQMVFINDLSPKESQLCHRLVSMSLAQTGGFVWTIRPGSPDPDGLCRSSCSSCWMFYNLSHSLSPLHRNELHSSAPEQSSASSVHQS